MKELIRKQTLLTDTFAVEVDVNVDNHLALVEINAVQEIVSDELKTEYQEVSGATLSLDYEEIDALIEVLKYASDHLKRSDNEFAK